MRSHLLLLVLFAFFVSLVFALIARTIAGSSSGSAAMMFAGFLGAALVLGWLMYPFPL